MNIPQRHRPVRALIPVVLFTAFLAAFSLGAMNPITPALVGEYGGTTFEVGLLYAKLSIANFVASPVLGILSDRYGRRPILVFSLLGISIGYFIGGQASRLNLVAPVYVAIAAFIINAIWVHFALPETNVQQQRRDRLSWQSWNPLVQLSKILQLTHIRWLLVSFFLTIATTVITLSNLSAVAREVFGWTPQQLAIPFAVYGVVDFIGPLWASWLYRAASPSAPYWVGVAQMLIAGLAVILAMPKLRVAERLLNQAKV